MFVLCCVVLCCCLSFFLSVLSIHVRNSILLLSPFLRLSLLSLFPFLSLMLVCYTHIFHVYTFVYTESNLCVCCFLHKRIRVRYIQYMQYNEMPLQHCILCAPIILSRELHVHNCMLAVNMIHIKFSYP